MRDALASGKPLDPTIAADKKLRADYRFDESVNDDEAAIDDEWSQLSGLSDPRVIGIVCLEDLSVSSTNKCDSDNVPRPLYASSWPC